MNGLIVEYLLGLYFIIVSISYAGGRISADAVKLIAGIILTVAAVIGFSLVR